MKKLFEQETIDGKYRLWIEKDEANALSLLGGFGNSYELVIKPKKIDFLTKFFGSFFCVNNAEERYSLGGDTYSFYPLSSHTLRIEGLKVTEGDNIAISTTITENKITRKENLVFKILKKGLICRRETGIAATV